MKTPTQNAETETQRLQDHIAGLETRLEKARDLLIRHHEAGHHCGSGMTCPVCSSDGKDGPWNEAFNPPSKLDKVTETDAIASPAITASASDWRQCKRPGLGWGLPFKSEPVLSKGEYRVLTTFERNGKTYFSHKPGDEMPIGHGVQIAALFEESPHVRRDISEAFDWKYNQIIGWYPVALAEQLGNVEKLAEVEAKPLEHHQPPAPHTIHNPDKLTPEQVGPDHRLLCTVEVDGKYTEELEWWNRSATTPKWEHNDRTPYSTRNTYRVPLSTPWPEVSAMPDLTQLHANGAKAWRDVPDGSAWVEQLRGNTDPRDAQIEALKADLLKLGHEMAKTESRCAFLTPRPVSQKPTKEESDPSGSVIVFTHDGLAFDVPWQRLDGEICQNAAYWLPGNLSRLCPELMPKPEDKERSEFERQCAQFDVSFEHQDNSYTDSRAQVLFEVWLLARKTLAAA